MIDNNNNNNKFQTTATPPADLLKIMILQRREDALQAIESFYQLSFTGATPPNHIVRSRIISLYIDLEPCLRRSMPDDKTGINSELNKISSRVFGEDVEKCILGFRDLNNLLDQLNITRVDTRKKIDTSRVENENEAKGL